MARDRPFSEEAVNRVSDEGSKGMKTTAGRRNVNLPWALRWTEQQACYKGLGLCSFKVGGRAALAGT